MVSNHLADFVIVTALEEELNAVLDKLQKYRKLPRAKDDIHTYYQADLPVNFSDGSTGKYRVIVTCFLRMGQKRAATATVDAIRHWHPRYIVLVGIAGGIAARNVQIGDILIPDQIIDYEWQKWTRGKPEIRWDVQRADAGLLNAGKNFQRENWSERIKIKRPGRGEPICHIGPIASGDKVIAAGEVLDSLLAGWPMLLGVEMEAAGVATAADESSDKPGFFMVRGVSDLADENKGSTVGEEWRPYARDAAASFVIALLSSGPIPVSEEISQNKYIKKISKQRPPFPIEFRVETPQNEQIVRKEDCPLSASGTFSSEKEFYAWVILDDEHGNFYLQYPPIDFLAENRWKATKIKPGQGIEHIHFVYVDEQGNLEFQNMVSEESWGAFKEFPPNSNILCTISIRRVT